MKNFEKILNGIRNNIKDYVVKNDLKSLVLGISGGVDSALVAAIVKPVCDKLNIPLIGAWIEIEGNKIEERERAIKVGEEFCTHFLKVNLKAEYNSLKYNSSGNCDEIIGLFSMLDLPYIPSIEKETENEMKIRLGNIKARMRMIYLYNLAQKYRGCTLNTDNKTEYELGFWTIHGDDFDVNLLINLWKTEVYQLANYVLTTLKTDEEKEALQLCINAVPTDGLGITNSDFEQFGCNSYDEVDAILQPIIDRFADIDEWHILYNRYGKEKVDKIFQRHLNSAFKRRLPIDLTYKE